MQPFESVIFYSIETAIKTYRQFAHKRLKAAGLRITVDQWLTLSFLSDNPTMSQKDLAAAVFKDTASVTRILDLLTAAGYVVKKAHTDGRRSRLTITPAGKKLLAKAGRVVAGYRKAALKGISQRDLRHAAAVMDSIIVNCS